MRLKSRVLTIAGSDSGGGAGIQADIKTITALGAYALTAITALTAQDTEGVRAIHTPPPDFIKLQITMALADPGADAIKTGMLGDAATIEAIADALKHTTLPLVLDPVMVAKGGANLLANDAVATVISRLLPLATLLTPNLPEAAALTGRPVHTLADMRMAATALRALGARSVLLKGGHMEGDVITDLLMTPDGIEEFSAPRIESRHTHGTGCTLASAIATRLAQNLSLRDAVLRARAFVRAAIATAPGFGTGHGPLNHVAGLSALNSALLPDPG